MAAPLILTTTRLRLTPFQRQDKEVLHRIFTDPFVRKFLWDDEIIPAAQTESFLEKNEQHFAKDHWGLWKIQQKDGETIFGFAGLWYFFEEPQPQLVYGLLPAYAKKGYATEASQAVIDYAFQTLKFPYLIASCDTPHQDSKRVAERLHMDWVEEKTMNSRPTTFYRIDHHE